MNTTLVAPTHSGDLNQPAAGELTALLTGAGVSRLDDTGWIRVTGSDRVRWLNGMVTNSIQKLTPGQGCYNFVLNAQGRIQGDLNAFAEPDALLLETGLRRLPELTALLDHFIIMDDVELTDVSAERSGLGVAGPAAAELLQTIGLSVEALPEMHLGKANWHDSPVTLLHGYSPLIPRVELWAEPAAIAALEAALLASGAVECSAEALEALRILSGIPRYGTDIRNSDTARDLPQETGQTRALHFAKGCYLGQEIVERIRSRGNVHRSFHGFELHGDLPQPGVALESDGKAAGELTSVAAIPLPGRTVQLALGYVRREALERSAALSVAFTYPGGTAVPVALPYSPL